MVIPLKLRELLADIEGLSPDPDEGLMETEIEALTCDSRKAGPGVLFVCLEGEKADGHDFAAAAAAQGSPAVLAAHRTPAAVPHILCPDTRRAYALACGNFYGNPARRLKLIGVTGTNGKSTTAFILKHILEESGHHVGLIGTIQNMSGKKVLPSHLTTPEPLELHRLFKTMADDGCDTAVMEVSSHALAQERVAGCRYAAGIFTNLTQDHLDFHKTMANYEAAKQKLFAISDIGIINLDDGYAQDFIRAAKCPTFSYSAKQMGADYTARNIRYRNDGIDYELVGTGVIGRVSVPVPGSISVYNTLAAAACAAALGIPFDKVLAALRTFRGVRGRIEVVPTGRPFSVIVDYAHTPDALEKILRVIRAFASGKVTAVFGCGGDRDKTKRPVMGRIAARLADKLVVTSDNPRTEDPNAIIEDILVGVREVRGDFAVVENRIEAIEYAMTHAEKDEIILLAGKGHEDYQILKTGKIHLDEREVVADVLRRMPPLTGGEKPGGK